MYRFGFGLTGWVYELVEPAVVPEDPGIPTPATESYEGPTELPELYDTEFVTFRLTLIRLPVMVVLAVVNVGLEATCKPLPLVRLSAETAKALLVAE